MRLRLAPSKRLAAALLVLHAAAAAAAFASLGGLAGAALAAALGAAGAQAVWSRALLRSASSPAALELEPERLVLVLRHGERLEAPRPPRRYVSRLAVALPLRGEARRTVFVVADMLDPGEFRALRLWALWGRTPRLAPLAVAEKQLPA